MRGLLRDPSWAVLGTYNISKQIFGVVAFPIHNDGKLMVFLPFVCELHVSRMNTSVMIWRFEG